MEVKLLGSYASMSAKREPNLLICDKEAMRKPAYARART